MVSVLLQKVYSGLNVDDRLEGIKTIISHIEKVQEKDPEIIRISDDEEEGTYSRSFKSLKLGYLGRIRWGN